MAGEEEWWVRWVWEMLRALSCPRYKKQAMPDIPDKARYLQSISVDSRRPEEPADMWISF